MNCACGSSNNENAKFCIGCGQPIIREALTAPAGVLCGCGIENRPQARFCVGCGQSLQPSAPAKPAVPTQPRPVQPARRGLSRTLKGALFVLLALGASAAWYFNRPVSIGKVEDVGVYSFIESEKVGLIDAEGNVVTPAQWDLIGAKSLMGNPVLFSEGLMPVQKGGKWGYIDTKGKVAITPQFEQAEFFSGGLAKIRMGNQGKQLFGFIDRRGRIVIKPKFEGAGIFSEGLALVMLNKRVGYIDQKGKLAIPAEFEFPETGLRPSEIGLAQEFSTYFSEGVAPAYRDGAWGYIRKDGKFKIEPQFELATCFSEGMAGVKAGGKFGFIDKAGSFAINPQFDFVMPFSNGIAIVGIEDVGFGTIDRKGNYVIKPEGGIRRAQPISRQFLMVTDEQGTGIMSADGKWVLEPMSAIGFASTYFGKVFTVMLKSNETKAEIAAVSKTGKILTGKYKGSTLSEVGTRMAQEKKVADESESARLVEQAQSLFDQGQIQQAQAACENALKLMPTNAKATELKTRIEQTLSILGGQ